MDPASCKRQKHEIENDSSSGTQSPSSIINQNRSIRLNFLAQLNDMKYGSVTEDYNEISKKRQELLNTLKQLQLVPIKLPCSSPVLKPSDARLHGTAQSEINISSANIIDLDSYNVGDHIHGNMDNFGDQETTCVVDYDDEDLVQSFEDGNSSRKKNADFIEQCSLAGQSGQSQDIIMLDTENCGSEAQLVVKQGMEIMVIDNEVFNLSRSFSVFSIASNIMHVLLYCLNNRGCNRLYSFP